jgi:UDP-3-O-[3-hydroxymyristoyl] glucosamine N-acyltransferase
MAFSTALISNILSLLIMADVDPSAVIGNGVKMADSTVIEGGAQIGENCDLDQRVVIEKHAVIGSGVKMGEHCVIERKVNVGNDCVFGKHVVVEREAVIGSKVKMGDDIVIEKDTKVPDGADVPTGTVLAAGNTFPNGTTLKAKYYKNEK